MCMCIRGGAGARMHVLVGCYSISAVTQFNGSGEGFSTITGLQIVCRRLRLCYRTDGS